MCLKYRLLAFICFCICLHLLFFVSGCGPEASSAEQIAQFNEAGPLKSAFSFTSAAQTHLGPYRVVPGDILEFQMHVDLRIVSSELAQWLQPVYGRNDIEPYLVRVSDAGTIILPIIGQVHVAGKTLAEIESAVINTYYPKYVVNPPMLVCQVKKYQAEHERVFTVIGLVNKPDAFPYPPDVQYNLMEALAFAGGFDMVADPRFVKVFRQDSDGQVAQATFNIDDDYMSQAYKVSVKPGDVIYVDHTLRTRINKFLSDVFHITVGADARYRDL